ncbi:MAG: AI-2E family transporter [Bacillota bacterium]
MNSLARRYWHWALFAVFALIGFWLLWKVRAILLPFVLGAVIAYVLEPAVAWAEQQRLGRVGAVIGIVSTFLGFITLLLVLAVPVLVEEITEFAAAIPTWAYRFQVALNGMMNAYESLNVPEDLTRATSTAIYRMSLETRDYLVEFAMGAPGRALDILGGVVNLLVTPFVAIYFMLDGARLIELFWRIVPDAYEPTLRRIGRDLDSVLSGFLRGYLLVALILAVLTGSTLGIIGVHFAAVLGAVAGLTNFIPYFGPFIGAIPAMIVAAFQSPTMVLWVAGAYIVIQQIEGMLLTPTIIGRRTGLTPLTVIFSVLGGGALAGVWGMVLAVPTAAVLRVLLREVLTWALDLPQQKDREGEGCQCAETKS